MHDGAQAREADARLQGIAEELAAARGAVASQGARETEVELLQAALATKVRCTLCGGEWRGWKRSLHWQK